MSDATVQGRLVPRDGLTAADVEAMRALLAAHFDGVTPAAFAADLTEKNWALLLERGSRLVGFSTLHVYDATFDGEPLTVVFSGDTIVAPEAWSSTALPREWIAAVNQLRGRRPDQRCVWLLITSGFRTYRLLPVFWRRFVPSPAAVEDLDDLRRLRDHLARERFGDRYDAATGVVRLAGPQRLRRHLAGIPPGRLDDPHVAFFAAANPGHDEGDELVCVAELGSDNLTPAGRRMVFGPGGGR